MAQNVDPPPLIHPPFPHPLQFGTSQYASFSKIYVNILTRVLPLTMKTENNFK